MSTSQAPAKTRPLLARGSRIILMISAGPSQFAPSPQVEVPDVRGLPQGDALSAFQEAGLPVQVFNDYNQTRRKGSVIAQLPQSAASASAGSQAVILVSSGSPPAPSTQILLPDTVGMTESEAVSLIQSAGFAPKFVHEHSNTVPEGVVIAQLPDHDSLASGEPGRPKPWMWAAGIGALLVAVALLVAMFSGGRPSVPDVAGMTEAEASRIIVAAGFVVGSVDETASANVPVGTVVSQSPAARTQASKGSAVNLALSTGPALVLVPDVAGMNQVQATKAIEKAGFKTMVTRLPNLFVNRGLVADQTPSGGAMALPGTTIEIVISEGKQPKDVQIPDVEGLTRVDAERVLREAGFVISVAGAASDAVASDVVISQTPLAGEKVLEGSRVGIVVSSGPPTADAVEIPNVVGATLADAEQTLADAGFQTVPAGSTGTGKPTNQVVAQLPAAGAKAQRGSPVVLFYAIGP